MTLKINPIVATLLIAGIIILIVALFKGCYENKGTYAKYRKADSLNTVLLNVITENKIKSDSTTKAFQDSLEFERGQKLLAMAQKERTEDQLDISDRQVRELLDRYKYAKYTDTTAVTVPGGFVDNCHDCFVKLEDQNKLVNKYRIDVSNAEFRLNKQVGLYEQRFKELDQEKLGFTNKITSLLNEQKKYTDKLEPHGRLYLSWGVLWNPWPVAAGGGLMYQNKRNLIYGLKGYYGRSGTTIETTINFPLSLKFK